jgi:hypothetical protein
MFEAVTIGSIKTLLDIIITIKEKIIPGHRGRGFNFERVIEPLFNSLQAIVDDYFIFFRRASTALRNAASVDAFNQVIFDFRTDREKMITARIMVRSAAEELIHRISDEKCTEFFFAIINVFSPITYDTAIDKKYYRSVLRYDGSIPPASLSGQFLSDASLAKKEDEITVARERLNNALEDAIAHLEMSWVEVAKIYLNLRFEYLKQSRLQ